MRADLDTGYPGLGQAAVELEAAADAGCVVIQPQAEGGYEPTGFGIGLKRCFVEQLEGFAKIQRVVLVIGVRKAARSTSGPCINQERHVVTRMKRHGEVDLHWEIQRARQQRGETYIGADTKHRVGVQVVVAPLKQAVFGGLSERRTPGSGVVDGLEV